MKEWKTLNDIGDDYEKERQKILVKLKVLEDEMLAYNGENKELEKRIQLLKSMERDMRELAREAKRYYEKGWWRSEHYTFNARKPRNYSFAVRHEE